MTESIIYFDIHNTIQDIYNIGIIENKDISYILENKIKSIQKLNMLAFKSFQIIFITDDIFNFNIKHTFTLIKNKDLLIHIKNSKCKEIYIYNKNDITIKLLNIDCKSIYIINNAYKTTTITNIQNNLYNKITKKCKYLLLDKKKIILDITLLLTFLEYKNVIYNSESIIYDNIIKNYIEYLNKYNTYIINCNLSINFNNFKNYINYFIDNSIKINYNYNFNYNSKNYRYLKNLQWKFSDTINSNVINWEIYNIKISLIDIIIYIEKYNTFLYNVFK
jgi:hypothetical protein